jgi:hypothetical protein
MSHQSPSDHSNKSLLIPQRASVDASATSLSDAVRSRRAFLRRSATVTAVAVPGIVLSGYSETKAGTPKPSAALAKNFMEIAGDEAAHVEVLQALLDDPDNHLNPKIRPTPTLRNLVQPNFLAFLEAAAAFENTGSGVYQGALIAVQQVEEYFPTAAGITTVESRHAAYINSLLGEALVPDFAPVESPIDQTVTLSRVAPFIKKLNAPKPSFDPVNASSDNNFAIIDFLLVLEYVEAAFYAVNVPKFFHG